MWNIGFNLFIGDHLYIEIANLYTVFLTLLAASPIFLELDMYCCCWSTNPSFTILVFMAALSTVSVSLAAGWWMLSILLVTVHWVGLSYIRWSDTVSVSLPGSNKPNPNQLSNNVKPTLVNGAAGAGVPGPPGSGQTPGLGRACESCYSKSFM